MSTGELDEIADLAGVQWFDYQVHALTAAGALRGSRQRVCLYYKTGAGKSLTALGMVKQWGHGAAVVIAPPSTHAAWTGWAQALGLEVETMSHAKFRMKATKLSRFLPVIADEFHLFGGHGGQGWKKLDTLALHLQAPLVLASATPNYNDAERVYCISHILDPHGTKGGYLEFLYRHCNTRQNPFGVEPLVDERIPFRLFKDAAAFLSALPHVYYLPDDLVYQITDIDIPVMVPALLVDYGLNHRKGRLIASQIEERHAIVNHSLIGDDGHLRPHVYQVLEDLMAKATGPVLVFATHSTVAASLALLMHHKGKNFDFVNGSTSTKKKAAVIERFNRNEIDVLIGTASLATGTDGMDKICDTLIILDDTDDDALRRQLIGRIMPRGTSTNATAKSVYRLVLS
jgi:superfamily II DNA or RNA helicase